MAIDGIMFFSSVHVCTNSGVDAEWERIMRRLKEYGVKTTGAKAGDWAKLRDIEMQEAKDITVVTGRFLTVTKGEQEKIIARKKEKRQNQRVENNDESIVNTEKYEQTQKAMTALGQQIYFAILKKQKQRTLK